MHCWRLLTCRLSLRLGHDNTLIDSKHDTSLPRSDTSLGRPDIGCRTCGCRTSEIAD
jgi:hypothetical protein